MRWWQWKRAERILDTWVRTLIGTRPYAVRFEPGAGSFVNMRTRDIVVDPTMADGWGGTALLPYHWRGTTVRTLAHLQFRISRTMARHESGHVLFTDDYAVTGQLHAWLVNALEDERMERLMGRHYRPARADFAALGTLLWQHKPLTPVRDSSRGDRLLNACLFWRWDHLRPKATPSRWQWGADEERELWEERIRPLVEEAWTAPTAMRVAEIALKILTQLGLSESATCEGHDLMPGDIVVALSSSAANIGALGRAADDTPLSAAVDDAGSPAAGEHDDAATLGIPCDEQEPPEVDSDPSAGSMWMRPYGSLQREVGGQVRRLLHVLCVPTPDVDVRLSDSRGTFSARAHVRSRGELPLLHRRVDDHDPRGLAMVLLIDRTGSMGGSPHPMDWARGGVMAPAFEMGRMPHARRAAMLLDMTCTAAEIPLCIGYAGNHGSCVHQPGGVSSFVRDTPVTWVRDWTTPPEAEGPRALLAGMYGDCGDECYSASLKLAQAKLRERSERTRVIIYLLDGRPTDESTDAVRATVEQLRRVGTLVVGLFVGDQSQIRYVQDCFGADHTVGVEDLAQLPERLGRLLLRYARHQ